MPEMDARFAILVQDNSLSRLGFQKGDYVICCGPRRDSPYGAYECNGEFHICDILNDGSMWDAATHKQLSDDTILLGCPICVLRMVGRLTDNPLTPQPLALEPAKPIPERS